MLRILQMLAVNKLFHLRLRRALGSSHYLSRIGGVMWHQRWKTYPKPQDQERAELSQDPHSLCVRNSIYIPLNDMASDSLAELTSDPLFELLIFLSSWPPTSKFFLEFSPCLLWLLILFLWPVCEVTGKSADKSHPCVTCVMKVAFTLTISTNKYYSMYACEYRERGLFWSVLTKLQLSHALPVWPTYQHK